MFNDLKRRGRDNENEDADHDLGLTSDPDSEAHADDQDMLHTAADPSREPDLDSDGLFVHGSSAHESSAHPRQGPAILVHDYWPEAAADAIAEDPDDDAGGAKPREPSAGRPSGVTKIIAEARSKQRSITFSDDLPKASPRSSSVEPSENVRRLSVSIVKGLAHDASQGSGRRSSVARARGVSDPGQRPSLGAWVPAGLPTADERGELGISSPSVGDALVEARSEGGEGEAGEASEQ
nr:hypothetical protein HK105_007017 [Polyrhizophydium stewartii]